MNGEVPGALKLGAMAQILVRGDQDLEADPTGLAVKITVVVPHRPLLPIQRMDIPAVCVSIDRFLQDTAPNLCLPFDRIGARHPGTPALVGSHDGLKQVRNFVFSFDS